MAHPFDPKPPTPATPKPPTPATPKPVPFRQPEPQPPRLAHTLAAARVAVLWYFLGLGLGFVGCGVAFVWLVTSPDSIDAMILNLTGRGRP